VRQYAEVAALNAGAKGAVRNPVEIDELITSFNAGRYTQLEGRARLAVERYPESGIAWRVLGVSLQAQGKDGLPALQKAVELMPDDADAYSNLGRAQLQAGRIDDAAASYRRALAIRPDFAEAHYGLGIALKTLGQLVDAVTSFYRALEIKPDYADAYYNLGEALQGLERLDDAVASYRRALEIKPDFADAHNNLGNALQALGQHVDAAASYQRALEIEPDFAEAQSNFGNALRNLGQLDDAVACFHRALEIKPDFAGVFSNLLFTLNYHPDKTSEEIFAVSRDYEARFGAPGRTAWRPHGNVREPGRRLKVGYVSPDFRRHPVAFFLEPILANHDREQVEIYCYAEVKREDDFTRNLRRTAAHWHSSVGLSDDAMAQLIREHQIDILVDLAGHSAGNRLLVFAMKPAPIQMTYLGYPGTTGLAAMDYRITDQYADPAGSDAHYSEALLRLPHSLWCYRAPDNMPDVSPLPALQNGHVTFGSFNNFNKIRPQCIDLWATLLRRLPESRLLMLTVPEGEMRRQLAEQFSALGISIERIEFHGKLELNAFLKMFQKVDIALDPFPVNGGTTTCESLWMGVPVVVLVGNRFVSRASYSLLSAVGRQEYASETSKGYIKIALNLAGDLPRLAATRAGLRARMAASPLTDGAGFTRNLEALYRQTWVKWCASVSQ